MKISTEGLIEITSHEGICLRPYYDSVNVLTWGAGHTAAAGKPNPREFPTDSDQPIDSVFKVLRADMATVEKEVNRLAKVPLEQHEFDALCSFHFNTGGLGRAALLKSLNDGDRATAADRFLGWLKPPEIEGRRRKEMTLFRDGKYSANGRVSVFPISPTGKPQYNKGRTVNVRDLLNGV